jgi:hypothetical protein
MDSARETRATEMTENEHKPVEIETQIHLIRGLSVILDGELGLLYAVPVKALLQAVRRNQKRFPSLISSFL